MDDLRQRLRTVFADGTVEELAAALGLIFKLSFPTQKETAEAIFQDRLGCSTDESKTIHS